MAELHDFNQRVIREFRANHGKVSGQLAHLPALLLTMTGARNGRTLTTPLVYTTDSPREVWGDNAGVCGQSRSARGKEAVLMCMLSERCHAAALALHHGHAAQRLDACKRASSSISTPQNISAGSSVDVGHGSERRRDPGVSGPDVDALRPNVREGLVKRSVALRVSNGTERCRRSRTSVHGGSP